MKGKPKFKYGDEVSFKIQEEIKTGNVYIIDEYGTWDDDSDVSYDIMVHNDKHKAMKLNPQTGKREEIETVGDCLYKHIREDFILN